ncbi:MAG: glutamyl-tRNA reductase [bacterium]
MDILVVGLSHHTAPIEIRERLAFTNQDILDAICELRQSLAPARGSGEGTGNLVLLSTCNRVEMYAGVGDGGVGGVLMKQFLCQWHGVPSSDIERYLYIHRGEDAVRHLYRVASGLDSMVIGEPQILGQLKEAYHLAVDAGAVAGLFHRLFNSAFEVAKSVRSRTGVGEKAVSVGFAAVELAKKVFADLKGKVVMLLGAGKMGELVARHLVGGGACEVIVANRTFETAVALARTLSGRAIPFEERFRYMERADIVISSTSAPHYVILSEDVRHLIHTRKDRPLFLIDIAVPRDIDPQAGRIDNVYLYNIDDLQSVVEGNLRLREEEARKAEALIEEEAQKFVRWLQVDRHIVPTIAALREKIEKIRKTELERTLPKLTSISDDDRGRVDYLTRLIVNKVLHNPIVRLKQGAADGRGELYLEAVRDLFALEDVEGERL